MKFIDQYQGEKDRFVKRILHLRDELFLVGYNTNEIEVKTLNSAEPVSSYTIEDVSDPMVDMDFHRDESSVLVAFPGEKIYLLNLVKHS